MEDFCLGSSLLFLMQKRNERERERFFRFQTSMKFFEQTMGSDSSSWELHLHKLSTQPCAQFLNLTVHFCFVVCLGREGSTGRIAIARKPVFSN
jgi:hypothetical protein